MNNNFLFSLLLMIIIPFAKSQEKEFVKLSVDTVSKITFEDLNFKEITLNESQFKFLTGKTKEEANGLTIRVSAPKSPYFLPITKDEFKNFTTPLTASLSKISYYTVHYLILDAEFAKTEGKSIKNQLNELSDKILELRRVEDNLNDLKNKNLLAELEKKKEGKSDLEKNEIEYQKLILKNYLIRNPIEEYSLEVQKLQEQKDYLIRNESILKFSVYVLPDKKVEYYNDCSRNYLRSEAEYCSVEPLLLGIIEFSLKGESIYSLIQVKYLAEVKEFGVYKRFLYTNDFIIKKDGKFLPMNSVEFNETIFGSEGYFKKSVLTPLSYMWVDSIFKPEYTKNSYLLMQELFKHKSLPEWLNVNKVPLEKNLPGRK